MYRLRPHDTGDGQPLWLQTAVKPRRAASNLRTVEIARSVIALRVNTDSRQARALRPLDLGVPIGAFDGDEPSAAVERFGCVFDPVDYRPARFW